jgi:hypothetical protein
LGVGGWECVQSSHDALLSPSTVAYKTSLIASALEWDPILTFATFNDGLKAIS